jgi:hypothetical protein
MGVTQPRQPQAPVQEVSVTTPARSLLSACVALVVAFGIAPAVHPAPVEAASCLRIVGGVFDAPGNDNYAANLNGEYVRIKNGCTSARLMTGWKLNDYGRQHVYPFPTGFKIGAGVTVTLYSGRGTRTATKLYWGRTSGAVWNNVPPERAYLRNPAGTLISSWSRF